MPEVNDDLAKKAGKDTLDAMKEDIEKYLEATAKSQNERIKSDAVFEKVFENTEIEIQPTMLDREYDAIVDEARMSAKRQGADLDKMIESEGKEESEKRFREEAQKRIKNSLIVEKIAEEEKIEITSKDTMEYINRMAMMYGMAPNQLFEELRKNPNSYAAITQQIVAQKVNEFLLKNNNFSAK